MGEGAFVAGVFSALLIWQGVFTPIFASFSLKIAPRGANSHNYGSNNPESTGEYKGIDYIPFVYFFSSFFCAHFFLHFHIFHFPPPQTLECEAFQIFCPPWNFINCNFGKGFFPVFSVFLGEKRRKNWKKLWLASAMRRDSSSNNGNEQSTTQTAAAAHIIHTWYTTAQHRKKSCDQMPRLQAFTYNHAPDLPVF